jgi:hypothetical protein
VALNELIHIKHLVCTKQLINVSHSDLGVKRSSPRLEELQVPHQFSSPVHWTKGQLSYGTLREEGSLFSMIWPEGLDHQSGEL